MSERKMTNEEIALKCIEGSTTDIGQPEIVTNCSSCGMRTNALKDNIIKQLKIKDMEIRHLQRQVEAKTKLFDDFCKENNL